MPLHGSVGLRVTPMALAYEVEFQFLCSSVVRAFAHGAMGRRIDPSWWTH